MANRYVRAAGGDWNTAATWASTSGGTDDVAVPTLNDDVFMDSNSGACTIGATAICKSLTQSGTPGVLTHNTGDLRMYGATTFLPGKYVAIAVGAVLQQLSTVTLTTGGNAIGSIEGSTGGTLTLGDDVTGIASPLVIVSMLGDLNMNGHKINGNSGINRIIVKSSSIGTACNVITSTAGSGFTNCDFQDCVFANGGVNLDLSAITGLSGDCGGNSMSGGGVLTFTPSKTCTFGGVSGSWSDVTKWTTTGASDRVPLPQDLARFSAMSAGQTITVDMPRIPDTDFSSATNTPAVTFSAAWSIYGSLNLTGVGTVTNAQIITFGARVNATLTSSGKSLGSGAVGVAMPSYTLTCADAYSGTGRLTVSNGTFSTVYAVTAGSIGQPGATAVINLGSGIWTLTSSGTVLNSQVGTLNASNATIALTYAGVNTSAFAAAATSVFNDIVITPGSGVLTFSGAFKFRNMTMASAGGKLIAFTHTTTYTQTGTTFLSGTADGAAIISPTLLNGGFETAGGGGADVFANWTESVAGTSTVNRDTTNQYAGTACCRLDVDASRSDVYVSNVTLTVGAIYRYQLWAKVSDATGGPTMKIINSGGLSVVIALTADWAMYSGYFVATGTNFVLDRDANTASKSIYIDQVTLTPVNNVVLQSTSAGTQFTLAKPSYGTVSSDYLSIKDSAATPASQWYAGTHSTDVSGNSGWVFTDAPAVPSSPSFVLFLSGD